MNINIFVGILKRLFAYQLAVAVIKADARNGKECELKDTGWRITFLMENTDILHRDLAWSYRNATMKPRYTKYAKIFTWEQELMAWIATAGLSEMLTRHGIEDTLIYVQAKPGVYRGFVRGNYAVTVYA